MKRALLVIAGFVLITLVCAYAWEEAGGRIAYAHFIKTSGRPLLDLIGFDDVRIRGGRIRYINWIPFVGAMLVTPGLGWRRRSIGLGVGLGVLYVSHVLLNVTQVRGAPQLPLFPSLVSDTLPFLLWLAAAHPIARTWFASALAQALPVEGDGDVSRNGDDAMNPSDAPDAPHAERVERRD